jgi:hypothetical protein
VLHLDLDLRDDLVQEGDGVGGLLAQHHQDGPLDIVSFLECRLGLGGDGPGRGHPQAGGPEDEGQVRPDARVLVGEHDDLHAVVRHVGGEVAVGVDHAFAEVCA